MNTLWYDTNLISNKCMFAISTAMNYIAKEQDKTLLKNTDWYQCTWRDWYCNYTIDRNKGNESHVGNVHFDFSILTTVPI